MNLSRRRFIEDALFSAAAAAAASGFVAPFARAQEKKTSPNEKLGVMIVGCGGRGGDHVNGYLGDDRVQILYLCDPDRDHAANRAKIIEDKTGRRPKIVADMREALDDPALDVVSCATVNHWHALCGVWAMQAGKHAYIEKPICHNIHEGKALIACAQKYGVMCQVGSQCRSNKALKDAFEYANTGGISIAVASLDPGIELGDGTHVNMTDEGTVVLEAEGHTIGLYNDVTGCAATVDGKEIFMDPADFTFGDEGHFINANFLARALGGEAEWDAEEETLMLRIPVASEMASD